MDVTESGAILMPGGFTRVSKQSQIEAAAKLDAESAEIAAMIAADEAAKVGSQVAEMIDLITAQDEIDRLEKTVGVLIKVTGKALDTLKASAKLKEWPVSHYVLSLVYADTGDTLPALAKRGRASIYVNSDGTPMSKEQRAAFKKEQSESAARIAAEQAATLAANAKKLADLRAAAKATQMSGQGAVIDLAQMQARYDALIALLDAE